MLQVGKFDSVEVRIALGGPGGILIRQGLRARLLADATLGAPVSAVVTSISATATPRTGAPSRPGGMASRYDRESERYRQEFQPLGRTLVEYPPGHP